MMRSHNDPILSFLAGGTSSSGHQNLFCQIDMEIFNFEMEKSDNQQDQLEFKDRGENGLAWKSPDDPGTGSWSFRLNPNGSPQLFLYEGQIPRWRSGHWNGLRWTGVPILQVRINFNISFVNNDDELTIMWGVRNRSIFSRLVVDEPGSVQRFTWHEQIAKWDVFKYNGSTRDISNMAKPSPALTYYLSAICTITDNPDDLASS
ncbi:hypothetical protein D5086_007904 [Populus alba]|uniref:Uncharacterized protein n=1 Tax=Populus alba TaxID=43335 RepID=A0ACC4CEC5_POPAL